MSNNIDSKTWEKNSLLIKEFTERRGSYEDLCQEVAYILKSVLQFSEIEYSTISHRAKTLKSFLGKLDRKDYKNPLEEITDFAR